MIMKVLIIDQKPHVELEDVLKNCGITVEQRASLEGCAESDKYSVVVLCPKSIIDLQELFRHGFLQLCNPVVYFEDTNERFITACLKLGCKDVIKKPARPEAMAIRICAVIDSAMDERGNGKDAKKLMTTFGLEEVIRREMKRASRAENPVSFLAIGYQNKYNLATFELIKKGLRETDIVINYKNFVFVILPGCSARKLATIEQKLEKKVGEDINVFFYKTVEMVCASDFERDIKEVLEGLAESCMMKWEKKEQVYKEGESINFFGK